MLSRIGNVTKFIVGISGAVTTSLLSVYPSSASWLPAVVAGITAILVYAVPNTSTPDKPTTPPVV